MAAGKAASGLRKRHGGSRSDHRSRKSLRNWWILAVVLTAFVLSFWAGAPRSPQNSPPTCDLPTFKPTRRVSKEGNMNPTSLVIRNLATYGVDVMWVSPLGVETPIDSLAPHSELQIHTFIGHVTRVLHSASQLPLAEIVAREGHPGLRISQCTVRGHDAPNQEDRQRTLRDSVKAVRRRRTTLHRLPPPQQQPPELKGLSSVQYLVSADQMLSGSVRAIQVKFVNLHPFDLVLRSEAAGSSPMLAVSVPHRHQTAATVDAGQQFHIYRSDHTEQLSKPITVTDQQRIYIIADMDDPESYQNDPIFEAAEREKAFGLEYLSATGQHWLAPYPRPATRELFMWPVNRLAEKHLVAPRLGRLEVTVGVISTSPRVLLIEDLLTEAQCEYIVALAVKKGMRSVESDGTGEHAHLRLMANESVILQDVHRQMADVLGLRDSILQDHADELVVTRTEEGPVAPPQHHFSDSDWRFCTLVVTLRSAMEGGGLAFPRAYDDRGLVVKPSVGSAVIFYSSMPDGNMDGSSLHGHMAVVDGEMWTATLRLFNNVNLDVNGAHRDSIVNLHQP